MSWGWGEGVVTGCSQMCELRSNWKLPFELEDEVFKIVCEKEESEGEVLRMIKEAQGQLVGGKVSNEAYRETSQEQIGAGC